MEPWYVVPGTRRSADSGTQQVYAPFEHYQARLWCIYWRRLFNVSVNNAAEETRANGMPISVIPRASMRHCFFGKMNDSISFQV